MKRTSILFSLLAVMCVAGLALAAGSTYTTTKAGSNNMHNAGFNGEGGTVTATVALPTTATANDVYQMVKIPANSIVTDVTLATEDLDDGSALVLDVGYGDNVDYFIDGATVGQTGGIARASAITALPLTLTASDTIDIKVITTAGTAAAGNMSLTVTYTGTP